MYATVTADVIKNSSTTEDCQCRIEIREWQYEVNSSQKSRWVWVNCPISTLLVGCWTDVTNSYTFERQVTWAFISPTIHVRLFIIWKRDEEASDYSAVWLRRPDKLFPTLVLISLYHTYCSNRTVDCVNWSSNLPRYTNEPLKRFC
jgi:hypothetical protein